LRLGKSKSKLAEAQSELLGIHIDRITGSLDDLRKYYEAAHPVVRSKLVSRLEVNTVSIVESILNVREVVGEQFDPSVASAIRTQAGHKSQYSLAKELGMAAAAISRIERGRISKDTKSRDALKYLDWLKEHGYNPYNF